MSSELILRLCETVCEFCRIEYETELFSEDVSFEKLTLEPAMMLKPAWLSAKDEEDKHNIIIALTSAIKYCWGTTASAEYGGEALKLRHPDGRCVEWKSL